MKRQQAEKEMLVYIIRGDSINDLCEKYAAACRAGHPDTHRLFDKNG